VAVSARTGRGLEALGRAVDAALGRLPAAGTAAAPGGWGPTAPTAPGAPGAGGWGRELSVRHRHALECCRDELAAALEAHAAGAPLDQVATGLRRATDALDAILGSTTSEDLLDRIFARFCLGK